MPNIVEAVIGQLENKITVDVWNGTSSTAPSLLDSTQANSESNPYIITNGAELNYVTHNSDWNITNGKYYKLVKDIYLNDTSVESWYTSDAVHKWAGGDKWFCGNFDGNGHVVYGLYCEGANQSGLFPRLYGHRNWKGQEIVIKNLGIQDSYISGGNYGAGAFVGQVTGDGDTDALTVKITIENCYADETVTVAGTRYAGGLVGLLDFKGSFSMNNCYSRVMFGGYPSGWNANETNRNGSLIGWILNEISGYTRTVSNCYVILKKADYDKGYNAVPNITDGVKDSITYTNVHAANENHSETTQHNTVTGVTDNRWNEDFRGRPPETKLSAFDFVNTWQSGKTTEDYLSLKIFDKTVWYDVESEEIWKGTSDKASPSLLNSSPQNSESNPYIIDTPAKLYYVLSVGPAETNGKYYKLSADIYLNDVSRPDWTNNQSLNSWIKETAFAGNLDGDGHTVYGLYYNVPSNGGTTALIPKISSVSDQVIKNIGIDKAYINAQYSGVLISQINKGNNGKVDISGCFVGENIAVCGSTYQAGIIALISNSNTALENCYSLADFPTLITDNSGNPSDRQGGLIGGIGSDIEHADANKITVKNCYAVTNNKVPVSSIANKAANTNFTNVYGTEKLDYNSFNFPNIKQLDITQMYGVGAETYMSGLDYENIWFLKYNEYPVLRDFCDQEELNYFKNSFSSGDGTKDNPYIINNAEQLYIMRSVPARETKGKYFNLACNINVNDITDSNWKALKPWIWYPNEYSEFCGIFNGNGYVISGLYINAVDNARAALFNSLGENSYIVNVGIENSYISGKYAAAIAGEISGKSVTVANSYVGKSVEVSAQEAAGGIVGEVNADYFTVTRCCFTGKISGNAAKKGGLASNIGNVNFRSITFSDSYVASAGGDKIISSEFEGVRYTNLYGTASQNLSGIFSVLTEDQMLGNSAITNMPLLDFDSVWQVQADATPTLRVFGDSSKVEISGTAEEVWSGKIATGYHSGDGTKSNPYIINTAEQLALLVATSVSEPMMTENKYYKLSNDIYINNTASSEWYNSETVREWFCDLGYSSIGFLGNLDGDGYTVYGICYKNVENNRNYGLLPTLGGSAVVENIAVADFYSVESTHWVGAVAGFISPLSSSEKPIEIRSCISAESNTVGGKCAGGLLGHDSRPIIMSDCLSMAKVEVNQARGTLIGTIDTPVRTTVKNCLSLNIGKASSFWYSANRDNPIIENVYSTFSAISVSKVSIGDITGEKARTTLAGFDFDNVWTTVENGTPVQRIFMRQTDALYNVWDGKSDSNLSGTGTEEDPFIIKNGSQLYYVAFEAGNASKEKYYKLANNIYLNDISDENWMNNNPNEWSNGKENNESAPFMGYFDGNGYVVKGLYTSETGVKWYKGGLFPKLYVSDNDITVKNVGIENSYLEGGEIAGVVAEISGRSDETAISKKVLISNCYVDESVKLITDRNDTGAGGIVGFLSFEGIFEVNNCYSRADLDYTGTVASDSVGLGALIGNFYKNITSRTVKDCYVILTQEDFNDGFNVIPLCTAAYSAEWSNIQVASDIHIDLTTKSKVQRGTQGTACFTARWFEDFVGASAKQPTAFGFDSNAWIAGGNTEYLRLSIFNKQSYFLHTEKVKINFIFTDCTVKELCGLPGTEIPFGEISEYDNFDWYLEEKCLRKFKNTVFPDFEITLYAKQKIEIWDGLSDSSLAGTGTEGDPYLIENGGQLYYALTSDSSGKYFRVTRDIYLNDVNDTDWRNNNPNKWVISNGSNYVFKGSFDGGGYTVYGIYNDSSTYSGFIPVVSALNSKVIIANIKISNSYFNGKYSGGLIGCIQSSSNKVTVSACYVDESVDVLGTVAQGGIIGQLCNSETVIKDCGFIGSVGGTNLGSENQGGIIGNNLAVGVEIRDSFAVTGDNVPVTSTKNSNYTTFENVYGNNVSQYNLSKVNEATDDNMKNSWSEKYMSGLDFGEIWQSGVNCYPELIRLENAIKGDVNSDGEIDIRDFVRYKKIILGISSAKIEDVDLDNDMGVASTDLTLVRKYLLNKYQAPEAAVTDSKTINGIEYKLVWNDEFNGSSIDYNKWDYGSVNDNKYDELITVTQEQDSSIVGVSNGLLKLNGRRYFDQNSGEVQFATSKSLETQKTMNFKYGYLEMKAKVPQKLGGFPAFWLLGSPGLVSRENTKYYTEIDIFENVGGNTIETNIHKWYTASIPNLSTVFTTELFWKDDPTWVGENSQVNKITMDFEKFATLQYEYHTYSMEWTPEVIRTYMDDTLLTSMDLSQAWDQNWTYANNTGKDSGVPLDEELKKDMGGFHDYVYILIQNLLRINDTVSDKRIDNESQFDYEYWVDYVRLYQNPENEDNGLYYLDENGTKVNYYGS